MSLERFLDAQQLSYETALNEMKSGRKRSHWMWYIFPQIKGLGHSFTAQYYAIDGRNEAEEYMAHPVLGKRMIEISNILLRIEENDARKVFGYPDDMKLRSSMTLFYLVSGDKTFKMVLDKFFRGEIDRRTVEILKENE